MRLALMGDITATHFARWVEALRKRHHELLVLSMHGPSSPSLPDISFVRLPVPPPFGYFVNAPIVARALKTAQPDLLHVHFASGYGTLATQSGYRPRLLSVWGSDVFQFPDRSPLHRWLIARNVRAMDFVTSTSSHHGASDTSYLRSRD